MVEMQILKIRILYVKGTLLVGLNGLHTILPWPYFKRYFIRIKGAVFVGNENLIINVLFVVCPLNLLYRPTTISIIETSKSTFARSLFYSLSTL